MASTGRVLATDVARARTMGARTKGLLGRKGLAEGCALVIEPAAQVHTLGMRFPIDVVFCDRDGRVLRIYRGLAPWRITGWVRGARYAVELAAGGAPDELAVGESLVFSEGSRRVP